MARVNVKKDYDWGLKKEKQVIDHIGEALGKGFEKLGKFDHFDYLGYRNGKQCYVEIKSIGGLKPNDMTASFCKLVKSRTGIPENRIYIGFEDVAASKWGYDGQTFG